VKSLTVRMLVAIVVVALLLSMVELSCIADEITAPLMRSGRHVDAATSEIAPFMDDVEASPTPILTR